MFTNLFFLRRSESNPKFYRLHVKYYKLRIILTNSFFSFFFSHFLQLNKLAPVFDIASSSQCSRQMRFLICSTLFPFCSDDISQPVLACRNVCEKVKSECSNDPIVKQYWPDFLDCEQLPQNEKRDLCLNVSISYNHFLSIIFLNKNFLFLFLSFL